MVSVAALAAGCSSGATEGDSDGRAPTSTSRSATTETTAAPPVEAFGGSVEDFYVVPDPLPEGAPGDLIRFQEVSELDGEVTVRVMYHSVDGAGRDRAVTGTVTRPTSAPPEGGWPVLATAPGTVGLGPQCALSREAAVPPAFGLEGVRVMTDYIGMGPVGEVHPYLSRLSEGHSVLDGARAAGRLPGAEAGSTLLLFGHSQGGHGAQSAHELAAGYAPDLDLVGTVSVAPAAMFDRTYGGIDDVVARIVMTMGLLGVATEHPDLDPADYLAPEVAAMQSTLESSCVGTITDDLIPFALEPPYWAVDPSVTEPAASILADNDVGNEIADSPLLLISGTADERVVHQRVLDLFERLCGVGQVTELVVLEGADHGTEIPLASDRIGAWLTARVQGDPATDSCDGEPATG